MSILGPSREDVWKSFVLPSRSLRASLGSLNDKYEFERKKERRTLATRRFVSPVTKEVANLRQILDDFESLMQNLTTIIISNTQSVRVLRGKSDVFGLSNLPYFPTCSLPQMDALYGVLAETLTDAQLSAAVRAFFSEQPAIWVPAPQKAGPAPASPTSVEGFWCRHTAVCWADPTGALQAVAATTGRGEKPPCGQVVGGYYPARKGESILFLLLL
jgi:hypothetical protein